jgi:hypothetical protein
VAAKAKTLSLKAAMRVVLRPGVSISALDSTRSKIL